MKGMSTMIKIRIKNADHEIDIRFPISESELFAKLGEIHAIEGKEAPQSAFVTEVYWPEEFSMLKDRFANLDELNYLAKRMESFDYHEYDQFLIGITKLENPTEKDLINLTFNLDHFTLCKDVSSYGKIGREYVMNTEGAVPAHDEDDPKYAAIGKDLIDRGLAQITEKGLLIYNPFDELTEVYDGQTFPEYYYENSLASAEVSYNGRTELLLLPGEELAIQKALARLGAPSDSDCEIKFCLNQGEDVLSHLANDYLYSALLLHKGILADRSTEVVSLYLIPCAYLCKHSVELKLKECLLEKYGRIEQSHSVAKLWSVLNEKELAQYGVIDSFIQELEAMDKNEMALRYGVSVKLEPLQEEFKFDIDMLLANTKYFFNVVDEFIVCKYRYRVKE